MRARIVLIRTVGALYIVAGLVNLLALADPEMRELVVSLGAVVFRYSMYIAVGIGMVLLRKWSAYVLALNVALGWVIFFTVYSGESGVYPRYFSLLGPVLLIALYYYTWPVLRPPTDLKFQRNSD